MSNNVLKYRFFGDILNSQGTVSSVVFDTDTGKSIDDLASSLPNGLDNSWFNKVSNNVATPIASSDYTSTLYSSDIGGGAYSGFGGIGMTKDLNALSFSITDLRSALVISHFMEMNNYGGFKWSEFLMNHFRT